jgi:hypothetical protein
MVPPTSEFCSKDIQCWDELIETIKTLMEGHGLYRGQAHDWCLKSTLWPAPGSEDTELGVLMEPEVGHGETEVYPRVQA